MINRWLTRKNRVFFTTIIFVVITTLMMSGAFPTLLVEAQGATPTPPQPPNADLTGQLSRQGARLSYDAHSKLAHYIGANVQPIRVPGIRANASRADAARGFLGQYGRLFGLRDQSQELSIARQKTPDSSRAFVRFQQVYRGVPVLGGELNVQVNAANEIVSTNGEISPNLNVGTSPTVTAATARQTAMGYVTREYQVSTSVLTTSAPTLWIYDSKLIGPRTDPIRLVWRMDVTA